jgi:hypothetical protein
MHNTIRAACFALAASALQIPAASAQVALEIKDFVVTPITGSVSGKAIERGAAVAGEHLA